MINEFFVADHVRAADMDRLWAMGWRHFGAYFFRYSMSSQGGALCHVTPLRIDLNRFVASRSQKRTLRRNQDLDVVIRDAEIDAAKEELFDRHRKRFEENVPESIFDFLSTEPASVPCINREICVYRRDELLAASFLDVGATATSAVYAAFEPDESKRSLGIFTMLRAIEYSRSLGARYYYPGYAYREPSGYDYKKNFAALEYLEWGAGWKPWDPGPTQNCAGYRAVSG
jgi:arginine-tRNA-protein transferase